MEEVREEGRGTKKGEGEVEKQNNKKTFTGTGYKVINRYNILLVAIIPGNKRKYN